MEEHFKIYVERLRQGKVEEFDFNTTPDFLEIKEKELDFKDPIHIKGRAYLAENELIIEADVETTVWMPCQICNNPTELNLAVLDILGAFSEEEMRTGIFNMAPFLREELLLEVPQFVECHDGKCPERVQVAPYFKKPEDEEEGFHPFKDLF